MTEDREPKQTTGVPAAPAGPTTAALSDAETSELYTASQWQLMWWKYRKHRLAMVSGAVIVVLYLIALFCEFLAPYPLDYRRTEYILAPPQRVHMVDSEGLHLPFVYALDGMRHPETLSKVYAEDKSRRHTIRLFVKGEPYDAWGFIRSDVHLIGVQTRFSAAESQSRAEFVCTACRNPVAHPGGALGACPVCGGKAWKMSSPPSMYLLGTDSLGRDLLTRIFYGARISMTVGLIGVIMTFILGLLIGVASGYYGGWVDNVIQRITEVIRSFPTIPLWLALGAALPPDWSPLKVYFGIVVVLSLIQWTGLARQVRGKILALREEDFSTAARLAGASEWRIMIRHLLPSFTSHILVTLTLSIPGMVLGETALSFFGLGLRPPITSWGVLLKDAMNVQVVALHPWLLAPAVFVILMVLAFNFVGDGMRDAADPYAR